MENKAHNSQKALQEYILYLRSKQDGFKEIGQKTQK